MEERLALSTTPIITEFMASNDAALADGDGNYPDWIEVHNPTATPIDLAGWHLTDNDASLGKWTFPDSPQSLLEPGEYLVVFASGQSADDYVDAGGNLHTNFNLSIDGEYLALTDTAEQVVHDYSPKYPDQLTDVSYGISQGNFTLVGPAAPASHLVPSDNSLGSTWTDPAFDDSSWTSEVTLPASSLLITELGLGAPDWIEVLNVANQDFATSGWTVAFNDPGGANGGVNSVESFRWSLPSTTTAGQVLTANDNANGLGNIEWDDDLPGWAVLMDGAGNVVDFAAWGYSSSDLSGFNVTIDGFQITSADLPWQGAGIPLVDNVFQIRREGNSDNDDASDFVFSANGTQGTQNANLTTPFPGVVTLPATLGVGYETNPTQGAGGERTNLALNGVTTQSSQFQSYGSDLGVDGDLGNFTHTSAGQDLPATWQVDLGAPHVLEEIVLHNRDNCCASRLRDITVEVLDANAAVLFTSALLNPENTLGGGGLAGPDTLEVDLVALTGGPILGQTVRVTRTPDPDLSGSGGAGNIDEPDVLSLGEVQVFGREVVSYDRIFQTDLESAMLGVNAGVYARTAFDYDSATTPLDALAFSVQYDDGFAAYLNGVKVAERNAPPVLAFDSQAVSERDDLDALTSETIDLSQHLNLLQDGENVLAFHGLNASAGDDDFLINPTLTGIANTNSLRYFDLPTPGGANNEGLIDQVADTTFSIDRGFYDAPIQVEITSNTPDAEIYFTTNGDVPTPATGALYTTAIDIDSTTVLRAAAFKTDYLTTNVDTQTYIFLDDVVSQDYQATLDAGFPTSWGSTSPDYGLDPEVIGTFDAAGNPQGDDDFGGAYAATIQDDLQAVPTLSIVTDIDYLFASDGIYTNSTARGVAWERPASVEWINPDGADGFQVDAGLRIQGGYFRNHSASLKHSFRLLFKNEYGPSVFNFPLFGEEGAVDEFNTIVLRAGANDGYTWDAARFTEQYTRDEFGRSLQRAIGRPSSHGGFAHLYINGIYWGLYNPVERPDSAFAASYLGGDADNWDAIHVGEAQTGDFVAWDAMFAQTAAASDSLAEYMELQGLNPDGSQNAEVAPLLNVESYVDYIMLNVWGGNWDWPFKNFWAGRNRDAATTTGFEFFTWDFENTIGNNRGRSPLNARTLDQNFTGSRNAGQPHTNLQSNEEYRMLFADRIHRSFFNDGVLTPGSLVQHYQQISSEVERAIVAESARWGDTKHSTPLTEADWSAERDWILNTYLPQRSEIVMQEFRDYDLYPETDAPVYNQHGGHVSQGFDLVMTAPEGTIYYTLDGSDPRSIGGAISGSAVQYTGAPVDLTTAAMVRSRALNGGEWSAINEASFIVDAPADSSNLRITEVHYNPGAPSAEEIDAGFTDNDEFEFIEVLNTSEQPIDLQQVVFSSAVDLAISESTVLAPGERAVVVENQPAFEARYGDSPRVLGQWSGRLSNGGETVTLTDSSGLTIVSFAYDDDGEWPAAADGVGPSLEIIDPQGDPADPNNWRASAAVGGSPGSEGAALVLAGDYDRDGAVTQSDYNVWHTEFGSTPSTPGAGADGNVDGVVDAADYSVWRDNLGATADLLSSLATNAAFEATPTLLANSAAATVDEVMERAALKDGAQPEGGSALPSAMWLTAMSSSGGDAPILQDRPVGEQAGRVDAVAADEELRPVHNERRQARSPLRRAYAVTVLDEAIEIAFSDAGDSTPRETLDETKTRLTHELIRPLV